MYRKTQLLKKTENNTVSTDIKLFSQKSIKWFLEFPYFFYVWRLPHNETVENTSLIKFRLKIYILDYKR